MIYGSIDGIKKSLLDKLEEIYDMQIPRYNSLTQELCEVMCYVTGLINREISVAIDRKGNILTVTVGDSRAVELPVVDIKEKKLSGVKIIHTHPNGNSRLSMVDISALVKLKLDCIVAIGVLEGKLIDVSIGFCSIFNNILVSELQEKLSLKAVITIDLMDKIKYIEDIIGKENIVDDNSERAIIVGTDSGEILEELSELAKACDVKCVYTIVQKIKKIDSALYIGRGKIDEINLIKQSVYANLVIFDDELSGAQVRNLEDVLGVKVIDRTTLILEIFARRARSKEAKIQVELAQLKYRLPRIVGLGAELSRSGGGIGTKGPGEKKLEIDKRHIRERVYDLTQEIEKIRKTREVQRERRTNENIPKISLVGYTNAGKSTLRNALCDIAAPSSITKKENVFEADMLFATLDVTTRAIVLPDNRVATVTDTVGFVRKLPHDLIEAFKSTLEEVFFSDLLLHVVDCSSDTVFQQIEAVNNVLQELGVSEKNMIIVLNKIDMADDNQIKAIEDKYKSMNIIKISAKKNINLEELLNEIVLGIPSKLRKVNYIIPYMFQNLVSNLHQNAKVEEEEYLEEGTRITASVDEKIYNQYKEYMVKEV